MVLLAISDVAGRADVLQRLADRAREMQIDAVLFVGSALAGGDRLEEWLRAQVDGRPPNRWRPEREQQEHADIQTLDTILDTLASFQVPVRYVPGDLDAPERVFLQAAVTHEMVTPNVSCVHRSVAFGPRNLAITGFGGLLGHGDRETDLVLRYPAWEAKLGLDHARRLDNDLILLFHTPPRLDPLDHHGGDLVGSQTVEEIIHTLDPQLVICGHAADGQGYAIVGRSLVVNPGPLSRGDFATIDLATRQVQFHRLDGVEPLQSEADQRIQRQIKEALEASPATKSAGIQVLVRNGVVQLLGSVRTIAVKAAAHEISQSVTGVERVENALTADSAVVARVVSRLANDPRTALATIDVTATGGEVTLAGVVNHPRVKDAAEEIARSVPGVRLVINELRVDPKAKNESPGPPVIHATAT